MALKLTDAGGLLMLEEFFVTGSGFTIELFTDTSGVRDDDEGQAPRALASGGGYAELDLDVLSNPPALVSGIPTIIWDDCVWTFTGPLDAGASIRGYLVLKNATIIFEELLASPFTPVNAGDTLTIIPQFKLGNGIPT